MIIKKGLMVAISVSRFPIVMDGRTFMHQTAYLAVQFCMNSILHHRILAFAVFAFHLTPSTYAFILIYFLCLKREKSPTCRSEKNSKEKNIVPRKNISSTVAKTKCNYEKEMEAALEAAD